MPTPTPRILPLTLIVVTAALPGQSREEQLIAKWEAKQKESWFEDGGWLHDFAAAKARAAKEGKVILAYFSRSYSP